MVYLDQISYVFIETLLSHWYAKMWPGCWENLKRRNLLKITISILNYKVCKSWVTCESVCSFIFFPHISSGTGYWLINVFHGSCTLQSVDLLLLSAKIFFLFYLINILQFYILNKYLSTRTKILLGSIHKLYYLIDLFCSFAKKCRKEW